MGTRWARSMAQVPHDRKPAGGAGDRVFVPRRRGPRRASRLRAMTDRRRLADRAANIWSSFQRNVDPLARGAAITPLPTIDAADIGRRLEAEYGLRLPATRLELLARLLRHRGVIG